MVSLNAIDPFSESNHRRENPSVSDRQKQATKEMELIRDRASTPKPKAPVAKPYVPEKPFWR